MADDGAYLFIIIEYPFISRCRRRDRKREEEAAKPLFRMKINKLAPRRTALVMAITTIVSEEPYKVHTLTSYISTTADRAADDRSRVKWRASHQLAIFIASGTWDMWDRDAS